MKLKNTSILISLLTLILLILTIRLVIINFSTIQTAIHILSSGFALEPDTPRDIDDPPFEMPAEPDNKYTIKEVLDKGTKLQVVNLYYDPNWERPAFKEYWHSKFGRWSYVPIRVHYALHRVFATYETASITYDFIHNLGIAEEYEQFTPFEYESPYDHLLVVVMNTAIDKIITYENQVVIVGEPQRSGLQAFLIPTKMLHPKEGTPNLLIQLVTPEGYEIDYTTEVLASLDDAR